ncbi:hypothetical protein PV963_07155 [Streptomyces coeruleorubidus]|uniref:hypothetical protein n=1 Tax=Streptomyces coeruleorubidus TaxID=116188 RepID=UPI00237FCEDF|nr:hypothetical protein [Streptomyces coeruleorubidus]WDV50159.1 hypothetical protein PV963_07155 [Streptomyces coeruleorubidus]
MWPGQQPPGGEQNPQANNPYQQPGYQQPNPYQQPGYQQQPNPYGQQPQWGAPGPAGAPQPPQGGGGGNRTKLVAIIAATAVVVAAGVTGFLVLGGDKDDTADGGKGKNEKNAAPPSPSAKPSEPTTGGDNPRGGEEEQPTVKGWKVVINPKWGTAFDVPADWEVASPTSSVFFEDEKSDDGKPLILMSAPAFYKSEWCTSDDDKDGRTESEALAGAGTKGADGAKNTDEVALNQVAWWVFGGYTQPDKKSVKTDDKALPYTTAAGVKGSVAWAWSENTPDKGKCASDGKAVTFGFKNSAGDFVAWSFFGAKGVKGEVPKETIMKILSTVRLHGEPTGG